MKTTAFLIRVAICFLLSLIPLTDLENQIYSARLQLRGRWSATPDLVILEADSPKSVLDELSSRKPLLMLTPIPEASHELLSDSDGVIRRAALTPEKGPPSLAWIAASKLSVALPRHPERPHLINYAGPPGTIPRCSVPRFLAHEGICGSLAGKIVLVTDSSDDRVWTPLGEMSRVEALANDVNTVVNHHPLYQASIYEAALIILAMVLIGAFYIIYYPVLISAIAVTGTGIALVIILFQVIFQAFDVYIPAANVAGSLLITYLIFTGYRLAFQENLQWRSLKQAQYLRELDQMKSNFLSLVSHDLKTPLAKIQATVERLRREVPASAWREHIDSIENSNNELKHYITSILNLSKIESQKVILNKKSNDVNQLIQQALKRLRPLAQQKSITIEESLEPLFSIECDADLLRQVITNLIDNAIKYSPAGSRIILRSREEEGFVRVEVED
ncbi:MAG: histidine kinase dimerization/phospho-acceptor domain-containing protein, partial [Bdellovibrionota bacterium]